MAITEKLTAIADAIRSKTGKQDLLKLEDMPQEIASIETGSGGGEGGQELADSIVDGSIASYNSNVSKLRTFAFSNCDKLVNINLPNCKSINNAFQYCSNLENVNLPSLETIGGSNTFSSCKKLLKVSFPSLTTIDDMAVWSGCNTNLSLILPNSKMASCGYAGASWNTTPFNKGNGYIYVPKALIEDYKVATNWVTFSAKFRAIEDYPEICGDAPAEASEEVS